MKAFIFIAAFLGLCASARADGPNLSLFNTNYCGDPIGAICGDLTTNSKARGWRLSIKRKEIADHAIRQTRDAFGLGPVFFKEINDVDTLPIPFEKKKQIVDYYVSVVKIKTTPMIGEAEITRLYTHINAIKGYLLSAIDEVFPAWGFTQVRNQQLKAMIESVKIMDSVKIWLLQRTNKAHGDYLAYQMGRACGLDGLGDNAFAATMSDGTKYLVTCPGALLGGPAEASNLDANLQNLLQTLGHEWGHHIDDTDVPEIYTNYRACMQNHHASLLGPRIQIPGEAPLDINVNWNDPAIKVREHLSEMVGDFWGARTVAQYLKQNAARLTEYQRIWALRNAYGALCFSESEGTHPTGDFRIGTLLLEDPSVRAAMGCQVSGGCTLSGYKIPITFLPR